MFSDFKGIFGAKSDKPQSNPHGWPHPTEFDLAQRPKRTICIGKPQEFSFSTNFVKTSKYELWDFIPKFLLEEFNPRTKIANCYFLLISCLQCVPAISNTGGYPTTLIPLLFVVAVDALFQIIEDISRHHADAKANASLAMRFNAEYHSFQSCQWHELVVGDLVKISTRDTIPADIVVLAVAEKSLPAQGICYVETKSLDGETNLKIRSALPNTLNIVSTIVAYLNLFSLFDFTIWEFLSADKSRHRCSESGWRYRNGASEQTCQFFQRSDRLGKNWT
jgi:magnesium-transporting ATPase (P-type)